MDLQAINKIAFDLMGDKRGHEWHDVGAKYYHGQRVAKLAIALRKAILPGDDSFDNIIMVAAWLHDICNGSDGWVDGENIHGKQGAERAREILKPFCTSNEINEIAELIEYHDDRDLAKQHGSDYLKILQDADSLDHRGSLEVWGTIVFAVLTNRTAQETAEYNLTKGFRSLDEYRELVHFELSKQIFDDKVAFYKEFIKRFSTESKGELYN